MLRAAEGWMFTSLLLVVLSVVGVYALVLTYELAVNIGQGGFKVPPGIRAHALALAATFFLLLAANHVLDLFDLTRSTRGYAFGAGFTDMNAQVPAQYIVAGLAVIAAILCIVSIATRGLRPAIVGAAVWAGALVVVAFAYPAFVQNVQVAPNQLDKERPFIERNITSTRHAFGLDRVQQSDVTFEDTVPTASLSVDRSTYNNIRLWDPRPLRDTLNQIQAIRPYYQFGDVDVDRYAISGEYMQVMLTARELVTDLLPQEAQSWVSRQLQYTHGYGVAMTRVNAATQEGLPQLIISDVPPVGPLPLTRPEIYYGEKTDRYVITNTSTPEFDYPKGDAGAFTTYAGGNGIPIGSVWERFLFATKFQDPNFMLNSAIQPSSKLLYRRNVRDRVNQIAPFLRLDNDPYIVVADGGLYWIHDAYTTTDRYPYSQPFLPSGARRGQGFNYIRNSVKIVTNAYDGSVHFYVTDPADPLIQTYARIFPDLFTPVDQAPASIRAHFRYPEDLFQTQVNMYQQYHMEDPRTFYLKEDLWAIPNEQFSDHAQPVAPYYVIMNLPGETRPEFILMMPFAPSNRENMIGWLAARSDEPNYGGLVVFKYPKDKLIFGPSQVETRIDQDPTISAQFTLWNQSGSRVIRGNMLVIPIEQSNLYVEPIYLQATSSPLPELTRVIVSTGNRIVMTTTLTDGLNQLFGLQPAPAQPGAGQTTTTPGQPTPGPTPPVTPTTASVTPTTTAPAGTASVADLVAQAQDHFQRGQDALRNGDFATYGNEQRALQDAINQLVQATQGNR
jgi:uncharacterized membrane protein (UPF0182 family)